MTLVAVVALAMMPCHEPIEVRLAFDRDQFKSLIERSLERRGLRSDAAVNLLLGTAAQESGFGTYLRQIRGPAKGVFQMEPDTFHWLRIKYRNRYPEIATRAPSEMEWDLDLAVFMARLRYRAVPKPLPAADDMEALATYWKQYYNTVHGAGTVGQFVKHYRRYVDEK